LIVFFTNFCLPDRKVVRFLLLHLKNRSRAYGFHAEGVRERISKSGKYLSHLGHKNSVAYFFVAPLYIKH